MDFCLTTHKSKPKSSRTPGAIHISNSADMELYPVTMMWKYSVLGLLILITAVSAPYPGLSDRGYAQSERVGPGYIPYQRVGEGYAPFPGVRARYARSPRLGRERDASQPRLGEDGDAPLPRLGGEGDAPPPRLGGDGYAPSPDNVLIAAPDARQDGRPFSHTDRIEYPTGEQLLADPDVRDHVIRNYEQRMRVKQRLLHAVIVPETSSDILIDANVQGLSDQEVKDLQNLAFHSVHKVIKLELNESFLEPQFTDRRQSDRGVGDPHDVINRHGDVIHQRILILRRRFPRIPLKQVSRGFQATSLPEAFEDYDVTDVDGRISVKELRKVAGTMENMMEAFTAFDRDNDGYLSREEFEMAPWIRRPDVEI